MKPHIFISFIASSLFIACSVDIEKARQEMMDTDREFSAMSVRAGTAEAFDFYMADSAILLRNFNPPYKGRNRIKALMSDAPRGSVLKWEPEIGVISESGELGYTIGTYELTRPDTTGNLTVSKGYYITIWQKQNDGNWKYLFDTGNILK